MARLFLALFGLAGLLLAAPASASGTLAERTLTPADTARLAAYEETRRGAIAEAKAGGQAGEMAMVQSLLDASAQTIAGVDIRGVYRCRTIKLGGILPLTVYDWFSCRIDEDDLGYRLVKTSGSQRLSGHFIDDARTRLLYYGAAHYADEKPKAYGGDADRDQVGYLFKVGPGRYRLELPLPKYESKLDILELVKR